jgi:hypothetical protein
MEMRRLATPVRTIERVLLAAYWLLAGYGLRASRAVGVNIQPFRGADSRLLARPVGGS